MGIINKSTKPGYQKTAEEIAVLKKVCELDIESLSDEELKTLDQLENNLNTFYPGKDMTEETDQLEKNARSVGQTFGIKIPEDED